VPQPLLALGIGDVHVLDADRAAIGLAQDVEDRAASRGPLALETAGHELAVEVPEREAVGGRVEVAVRRAHAVERVEVRDQVAAHAVVVDQLQDLGLLLDLLAAAGSAEEAGVRVHLPAHGAVRHAEVGEDALVEGVLALQQLLVRDRNRPDSAPWMMRWSWSTSPSSPC
jgi:hypothetical protein